MNTLKLVSLMALMAFALPTISRSQERNDQDIAAVSSTRSRVRFQLKSRAISGTLTVAAPDGRVFTREFKGATADFELIDAQRERLPDGSYTYELRINVSTAKAKRGRDDEPESVRASRKRLPTTGLVQSGGFSIVNGSPIVGGAEEPSVRRRAKASVQLRLPDTAFPALARVEPRHHVPVVPDQVIPDDLIVQGSECVGFDCVNNESFGTDTVRLKENNTRLQFDDTSTAAGFPTNNWQIRANDQVSGGTNFLGFVDQGASGNSESGTIIFRTDAGAPANSLRVGSNGKIGLRTATPVLDVHINTADTPAIRLEQNNTGGYSAQTWDIAGNEANFFVRDVTSGSRLPFRIRPGAPTSSIDINAAGSVGVGTASPGFALDVQQNANNNATGTVIRLKGNAAGSNDNTQIRFTGKTNGDLFTIGSDITTNNGTRIFQLFDLVSGAARVSVDASGNVGIGTASPDQKLSVNGDASKTGGNTWLSFSDERLKTIKGLFNLGLKQIMQLQPVRYQYLNNNSLRLKANQEHVGFGAQALQKVIPEAVTKSSDGYLMVDADPILWAMLNAIKEQQQQIEELKSQVRALQRVASRRR